MMSSTAMGFEDFPFSVRLETLAGGQPLMYHFWTDSEEVYEYPGSLPLYSDMVTWSFRSSGYYGESSDAHSFSLAKSEEGYGTYFVGLHRGYTLPDRQTDGEWNNTTFGYGYPMESMNLGVIYNRQGGSEKTGDTELSETWNYLALGVDYDLNDETNVDASFIYRSGKADDGDSGTDDMEVSGMGFMGRAAYAWKDDVAVVPIAGFMTGEEKEGSDSEKWTAMYAGLGFGYTVNEDNVVAFGAAYASEKTSWTGQADGDEESTTIMPGFYMATEHEFTDWLTLRGGATKVWSTSKDTPAEGDASEAKIYPFGFSLGAGIAMGDWAIDLGLNTGWLYNFGYWLHGNSSSSGPISMLQVKLFF